MNTKQTPVPEERPVDAAEDMRRRVRSRSTALGLVLAGLVLLFYIVTLAKLGTSVLIRPL